MAKFSHDAHGIIADAELIGSVGMRRARQRFGPWIFLDGKTVVGISGMNQVIGIEFSMADIRP